MGAAVNKHQAEGRYLVALVNTEGVLPRDLGKSELKNRVAAQVVDTTHSANVVAPLQVVEALLPNLENAVTECGTARIVNSGSLAGVASLPHQLAFTSAQGSLEHVSDALR